MKFMGMGATFLQISAALGMALFFGEFVQRLLKSIGEKIELPPPAEHLAEKWREVTSGNEGGEILGRLERVFFVISIWNNYETTIGAWLALKVASKWNAWANIVVVPKELPGIDPFDLLKARRFWGSHVLVTFLTGTLANLLIAFASVGIAKHVTEFVHVLWLIQ